MVALGALLVADGGAVDGVEGDCVPKSRGCVVAQTVVGEWEVGRRGRQAKRVRCSGGTAELRIFAL